jgi:hypothetical protein
VGSSGSRLTCPPRSNDSGQRSSSNMHEAHRLICLIVCPASTLRLVDSAFAV